MKKLLNLAARFLSNILLPIVWGSIILSTIGALVASSFWMFCTFPAMSFFVACAMIFLLVAYIVGSSHL